MGDVLLPGGGTQSTGAAAYNAAALPGVSAHAPMPVQTGKVLTGDLDSSLASLAENLTINKSASAQVK